MDQDSQNIDFLYDFVYLDRPRAQSWLAQLIAEGVPVSAKYSGAVTRAKMIEGAGGVPGVAAGKATATNSGTDTHERQFNTEWSVPLTLVDMLDGEGFLGRGLDSAQQGSLALVTGRIQLTDIGFLAQVWDAATANLLAMTKTTHANKASLDAQKKHLANIGGILKVMPKNPQIYMLTADGGVAWAVLKPEHSIVDTSMLTLTYGANIQGDWHMIAVIDALPDDHEDTAAPPSPMGGVLARQFPEMLGPMREAVGRSADAYAVNPVAIFRAVPKQ